MNYSKSLTFNAKQERLDSVISFIEGELARFGCPKDVVGDINVAVEELFLNVSEHAYGGDGGEVVIEVSAPKAELATSVSITLIDHGPPFNPLESTPPDTTLPLEEREVGGMGIHLVKNLMSEFAYSYENSRNNVIIKKTWGTGDGKC